MAEIILLNPLSTPKFSNVRTYQKQFLQIDKNVGYIMSASLMFSLAILK